MPLLTEEQLEQIAQDLASSGLSIQRGRIPAAWIQDARAEIIRGRDLFNEASIGKKRELQLDVRSDRTQWWDFEKLTETQARFSSLFQEIQGGMNQRLFLGLWDIEGHYAIYPPGSFYQTHLDRFANDSGRILSLVLFFNDDWNPEDGGELRVEVNGESIRVLPEAGTLVLFLSDRILHEVLPTRRERLSFAGWFRQRT